MNILQINTIDNMGGAAKVAYHLKDGLEKRGHTVNMFVGRKFTNDPNVFLVKKLHLLNKIRPILANDIEFFGSDYILKTEIFKKADIIHCHNLHGNYFNLKILEKILKLKPVVWTLHDMWAVTGHCAHPAWAFAGDSEKKECNKWQAGCRHCPALDVYQELKWDNSKYLWNRKKKIYEKSRLNVVVPSVWLKDKIEKSILKDQNVTLIHNGIDTAVFKRYDKKVALRELNLPADKKIITFIANGGKYNILKGWRYVQEVVNFYGNRKDILFLCIGVRRENEELDSKNLKYIEYMENESMLVKYYSASDIFLFTSLAENFPLVILEAMSCGTPIVSFNVGGIKEAIVHKQNGYIAEYKNSDDLIKGIEYIFGLGENEIKKMSESSVQRIRENFSLDIMVNNYLNFYQEVLNARAIN